MTGFRKLALVGLALLVGACGNDFLPPEVNTMDRLFAHARQLHGTDTLADDFSMLELAF